MNQVPFYGDVRVTEHCAYCAGDTSTRDHVPARVFLDEPYPSNLPTVPSCDDCNMGASADEEFIACLIDWAVVGSVSVGQSHRNKILRILRKKPALAARLSQLCGNETGFAVEPERLQRVITKLSQGHALFELNEAEYDKPSRPSYTPIDLLAPDARRGFEKAPVTTAWPEVGSRAMNRLFEVPHPASGWIVVQPGRYRYLVAAGHTVIVRLVLSEYLACEVIWE